MGPTPRTLDWQPNHDPRSRDYPIREEIGTVVRKERHWKVGPILDQGREGACVGFAWAAEAFADPIPVDLSRMKAHTPAPPNEYALFLYGMAQYLDQWPGQGYSGTSVLAGAKASQNLGTLRRYHWAFGVEDVIDAVVATGPVVIGIPWYSGMYSAPGGLLRPSGSLVGGHALLVVGYIPESDRADGKATLLLQNSWGTDWGITGLAEITIGDLAKLLADNGEACVPTSRSFGR